MAADACGRCGKNLSDLESPQCSVCVKRFHYECCTLKQATWRQYRAAGKLYTCTGCKALPRSPSHPPVAGDFTVLQSKVEELTRALRSLSASNTQLEGELKHLKCENDQLKSEVRDLKSFIVAPSVDGSPSALAEHFKNLIGDTIRNGIQTMKPTFASILKKDLTDASAAQVVNMVRKEQKSQEMRANNVIISGVDTTSIETAKAEVAAVLSELEVNIPNTDLKATLIGRSNQRVKVTLPPETRARLLQRCIELRTKEKYKNVFVNKDLTPAEQQLEYEQRCALRNELRKRTADNPGKAFAIRKRRVIELKPHHNNGN
jgi:hypothetical protein